MATRKFINPPQSAAPKTESIEGEYISVCAITKVSFTRIECYGVWRAIRIRYLSVESRVEGIEV